MIVTSKDFVARSHELFENPNVPDELKQRFRALGWAEPYSQVDALDIVDECFHCGEKLTTPYVYWQGAAGGISLHARCAMRLGFGLVQDVYQAAHGQRAESERQVAAWADLFASKKEYGLEDEELPPS